MDFYKWVIDPNILISYCVSGKLYELALLVEKHNIEICASDKLLTEFSEVISRERIKILLKRSHDSYVTEVTGFLSFYTIADNFIGSPDKKDD